MSQNQLSQMNIGGFNTDNYDDLTYLYFFLHSVLNPIMMLNFLIAILSSTFDRVNENYEIADGRELASIVLDGECIAIIMNSKIDEKGYIHVCEKFETGSREISDDDMKSFILSPKKKVSELTKSFNEQNRSSNNEISNRFHILEVKISNLFQKFNENNNRSKDEIANLLSQLKKQLIMKAIIKSSIQKAIKYSRDNIIRLFIGKVGKVVLFKLK